MAASSTARIHCFLVLSCVSHFASRTAALSFSHSSYCPAHFRHDTTLADNTSAAGSMDDRRCSRALPQNPGISPSVRSTITTRHEILTTTDHFYSSSSADDSLIMVGRQQQQSNWSTEFISPNFSLTHEQLTATGLSFVAAEHIFVACWCLSVGIFESEDNENDTRIRYGTVDYTRPYTESGSMSFFARFVGRFVEGLVRRPRLIPYTSSSLSTIVHLATPCAGSASSLPRVRRLLSGRNGRSATKQHLATHGKVKVRSSWSEQAFVTSTALVGLICAAVVGLLLCCIRILRKRQSTAAIEVEEGEHIPDLRQGLGPREFMHSELATATDNFAEGRKIGRGGFGPVYRGYLTDEDRHVAIKALSQEQSVQGLKEFQAEVTIMSQLRHRNIVRLVGWCSRRRQLALVYELMPGGSLDTHLYNPERTFTWPERYKIALQLGSALRYLHTDCDQCVVHGDIKPANVMLDASRNAKLGDFGIARLVDHGAEPQTTQVVAGTVGYIDPEFVSRRRPSAESDVYSFGVVLLEIACGRRPTPSRRPDQAASTALLASVRDMYRRNVILEAADRRLDGEFDGLQMERMLVTGLWCAHHDPAQRPSVAQAVDVLRSEDPELPVLGAMAGSVEIHIWEGQAYGDLSAENSAYLDASNETAYLTTEDSVYRLQM